MLILKTSFVLATILVCLPATALAKHVILFVIDDLGQLVSRQYGSLRKGHVVMLT
jgi:hypothetical protein